MTFTARLPQRLLVVLAAALLAASAAPTLASAAPSTPLDMPQPRSGPRPSAADITRWEDRKFGMFIHFGLFSILGGVWDGRHVPGYAEQIEANAPVPQAQYDALAKRFDPTRFDPDAIVALAKAAGMRYIVLTSKHHDGFAMFDTHANRFNVVADTPYKRDIVKQLADACARAGMPFGVYYSTIDWHWMHGQFMRSNNNPISTAQAAFNVEQIKELMHNYGPIAEFWFDMGHPTPAQSALFARTVHAAQPATMVSGRVWNYEGDFVVPDDNQATGVEVEVPWEAAASIFADTWGYRSWQVRTDLEGKIRQKIQQLIEVASRGGNYLLNIGPEGNGAIVPYEADVLRGIGAWLKPRGEAIYATQRSPFGLRKLDFGYAAVGPHALYLFIAHAPKDGVIHLPGVIDTRFGKGSVLADPAATVTAIRPTGDGVDVHVNGLDHAGYMPVVALPFEGALHVRPLTIKPAADGSIQLAPDTAERFLNYDGGNYSVAPTPYKLRWYADAHAGNYTLAMHYQPLKAAAALDVWVDGHATRVALAKGSTAASVQVTRNIATHPYAMEIELTPVAPFHYGDELPATIERVDLAPTTATP